jgi:hypothetical protein
MATGTQQRAVGILPDPDTTKEALHKLKDSGFPMEKVSVIAKQVEEAQEIEGAEVKDQVGDQNVKTPTGIVTDTATGAFWGSILVGLGSIAVPGIGFIIAAGSLGVGLVSGVASLGVSTISIANIVNALKDLGIPEESARVYADHLLRDNCLVFIEGTEDEIACAGDVLSEEDIQEWGVYQSA